MSVQNWLRDLFVKIYVNLIFAKLKLYFGISHLKCKKYFLKFQLGNVKQTLKKKLNAPVVKILLVLSPKCNQVISISIEMKICETAAK